MKLSSFLTIIGTLTVLLSSIATIIYFLPLFKRIIQLILMGSPDSSLILILSLIIFQVGVIFLCIAMLLRIKEK